MTVIQMKIKLLKPLQLPYRFGNMKSKRITLILHLFQKVVDAKTNIIQMGPNILNLSYKILIF